MSASEYFDLAVRMCVIGVAAYVLTGQVAKPGIRMIAKALDDDGRLSRGVEDLLRWLTRATAILLGAAMGSLPLWPEGLGGDWGPILGLVGGSLAPGIYQAAKKALPAAVARAISGKGVRDK
tara:strand:+ start:14799 stop:15164 length:366 start_codon:yes stop_codon:yes gene_type:complete